MRLITVLPGWHMCHRDPTKNRGIASPQVTFTLKHEGKAAQWTLLSGWGLPTKEFKELCPDCDHPLHQDGYPMVCEHALGGRLVLHLSKPSHDGHRLEECEILGHCYPTGSFADGIELFDILRTKGSDALFQELERRLTNG